MKFLRRNNDNYKSFVFWFDKIGTNYLGFVMNAIFNENLCSKNVFGL
jgi:hypothetical protein